MTGPPPVPRQPDASPPALPGEPDATGAPPALPDHPTAPDQSAATAAIVKAVEHPHPLTPFVRGWVLVVAGVWALSREMLGNNGLELRLPPLSWATGLGAVALLVLFVFAYLDWRATSFIADADELRIESGLVTKTSQRIRYDRIQAVDITQPFLPRLLGMAEITIDVGAEGGQALRYLSRTRAAAMRAYLLARAHGVRAAPATHTVATGALTDLAADDQLLIQVPTPRLVLGAVLSHEVLLGFLPAALAVTVLLLVNPELAGALLTNSWVLFGFALPAVAGLWSFLASRLAGQWHYAFVRSAQGLKITRGLTSLTSQSIPRHRIQSLVIGQPVWWRRLDLFRVEMAVLGNAGLDPEQDGAATSKILLPIGTRAEVDLVLATVWPGLRLADLDVRHSPDRARWLQPVTHRWAGWGINDLVLITQHGWLTRARVIVPHARLQSLVLSQGPLRRRLRLASIAFHTTDALTLCRVANLDPDDARRLVADEVRRARSARFAALLRPAAPTTGPG